MLNRLLLVLALLGMILAVHLWVQKARGFDQGCLGLQKPETVQMGDGGCRAAGLEASSELLGVSNAAWGYAFFFTLSLVTFGKVLAPSKWARRLHGLSEIAITGALIYAGYLVYVQAFVVHQFCVLCLITSGLIAVIFVVHALFRLSGGFRPAADSVRGVELGFGGGALFGAMGLLLAVLLFVDRLGMRQSDRGNLASEMDQLVGDALPKYIDPDKLWEMRACHFDWDSPRIDADKIGGPNTPFLGKADGVPVVIFYDPNCPHCRQSYPSFLKLIEKYKTRAKFYVLPRMLWDYSLMQIEALELARQQGKYFDMWKLQFARPRRAGMDLADLEPLFRQLGLPTDNLASRLAAMRPEVTAETARVHRAGVDATPTVFMDGLKVFPYNESPECLETLINRRIAADGPTIPAAAPKQ